MRVRSPPQLASVGVRLSKFVEAYNKRSLYDKYHDQGVQASFYESIPYTRVPMGDTAYQGAQGNSGHVGTNMIPNAPEECHNRGASRSPRLLLQHIPGLQSFRRVAPVIDKKSKCSHLCTSLLYLTFVYSL